MEMRIQAVGQLGIPQLQAEQLGLNKDGALSAI